MKLAVIAVALLLPLVAGVADFDFFYLVQQWPGSFCDTQTGCCFPDTGKPAPEFGIHGLWPNYAKCRAAGPELVEDVAMVVDGTTAAVDAVERRQKCWPENCDDRNPLKPWEIKDLVAELDANWPTLSCKSGRSMEFWSYEWKKHGTCSGMGQHEYFAAALELKKRHSLAAILADAGVVPSDNESYFLSSIRDAIAGATGAVPNLECNRDASGETQLFQVYQCVDRSAKKLVDCQLPMQGKCRDRVKLPTF
ncbi:ribonuclease 1 [Oryza brachyantha]|nr:ribonuclease 1 [Oryza brachyantha]